MKKSKSAKKPHRPVPPTPPRAGQSTRDDDYAPPKIGVMKRINTFASLAIALAIVASFLITLLVPLFSAP